ncbi:MAG: sulfite exporter TauE/SafE family protein [Xanthomonadales bacterium]|nr:sulfite exporter TauE/SafE family protein [Xanthomonadales bacterium]
MLKGAIAGTLVGAPIGIFLIAPLVPEVWVKVCFSVIWAGFGLLHLYRINEIAAHSGIIDFNERWDIRLGLVLGTLSSATVVAVTGVGIDMVVYAALVLLCRADLKIAIPTSVVIMAFASVYGVLLKSLTTGMQPGVFEQWLAAAPVVALGAPLGVYIVGLIDRKHTLLFVATLCVGQFVWTCTKEFDALGLVGVGIALLAVSFLLFVFERLRLWGNVLAGELPNTHHVSSLGYRDVEPHIHSEEPSAKPRTSTKAG